MIAFVFLLLSHFFFFQQKKRSAELTKISIGGGGYVPARILRSFLKTPGSPNIPIQAIGLSLYEKLAKEGPEEEIGTKVTRTQWLDFTSLANTDLIGKNILIVDEVDDTRTTLQYAVQELSKDVQLQAEKLGGNQPKTNFFIFVLQNKDKSKRGKLPEDMIKEGRYLAAETVGDVWYCYPWEAIDIDEHDRLATAGQATALKNGTNGVNH
ncbi:PRTase-like protein [Choiromyces venosus 120613-1]|uniref:PRTase-like protein n=1 Tax=Choiromyces venosus 120613-1 TaxID=1336337 RepID=A0A3N4JN07_9PEZI|nr:PRTase-like protein [Choiromyces venosus 120613-1]